MQNQQNQQNGVTQMRTFQILRDHLIKLADFGKPVHPYGDEALPPVRATRVGQSMVRFIVGNAFDLSAVITKDEAHKILFQYNEDGSKINVVLLSGKGMAKEIWNILYPTSIGSHKYVKTSAPVTVSKKFKTIGKIDGVTVTSSGQKEIRGCDFIITYDKVLNDAYEQFVVIDKIFGRGNYSNESLTAFAELMSRFAKKPTNAFDHILYEKKNHPAPATTVMAESTKKPAISKPAKTVAAPPTTVKKKTACVKLELPKFEIPVRVGQSNKSKNQIERELRSNPPINNSFAALQQLVQ